MPIYSPGNIILSKYRIERFIGAGAFGEVYQVRHTQLDLYYAIKVLISQKIALLGQLEQQVKRFKLEAQLGARLKSPRLLKVFDLGQDGENLVLAMEYAPGGSLKDKIDTARQEQCPIRMEEVVKIGVQVGEGLAVLHAAGCVHRDIKPANILFDDDGDARLGDLGLAQVPSMLGESPTSTFQNQVGTPEYMSPEQEMYAPYLRPPSDVYSLGLVLFEVLTGVNYKTQRAGTSAHSLHSGIPDWLNKLIVQMLEKDPERRPWDGTETTRLLQEGAQRAETLQAKENARREAEEKARNLAEEQARLEAEDRALREAKEKARIRAEELARLEAEERARQQALEQARFQSKRAFPIGNNVTCPYCSTEFYTEGKGYISCSECDESFTIDEDGSPTGLNVTCPYCSSEFYSEGKGSISCSECDKSFTIDEDGSPSGLNVTCPYCNSDFYTEEKGYISCSECDKSFTIDEDGSPTGFSVTCPCCSVDFYTDDKGYISCPECSESFTIDEGGSPIGFSITCPYCNSDFYTEEKGYISCSECDKSFTIDEDGCPIGFNVPCPYCSVDFYTDDKGYITCPECSESFTIDEVGSPIGFNVTCPYCSTEFYTEEEGYISCSACNESFTISTNG